MSARPDTLQWTGWPDGGRTFVEIVVTDPQRKVVLSVRILLTDLCKDKLQTFPCQSNAVRIRCVEVVEVRTHVCVGPPLTFSFGEFETKPLLVQVDAFGQSCREQQNCETGACVRAHVCPPWIS